MGRTREVLVVSLPRDMAREYEEIARKEQKNKSELFREMIKFYKKLQIENEFYKIQRYGQIKARERKCFTEKEIEALVMAGR
jgi:metal-responsive CopG/Arc/MetJ family transcriptional regulator